jgi:hypothetical protein
VGSGAYSTVYLATRKDSPGTDYAIKVKEWMVWMAIFIDEE